MMNEGKSFKFERDIVGLLSMCKEVLKPNPLFVLLNCYSMGFSPVVAKNLLLDQFPDKEVESGELYLNEQYRNRSLCCSSFARFRSL
jgi:23S rRNA (cytosine1962-C5)-methyltransferase